MLQIYLCKPSDTALAATDTLFIEGLSKAIEANPAVNETPDSSNADIVVLDEKYAYRTWRYRREIVQCSFIMCVLDKLCVINHDDHARVFFPGLYVSLEKSKPSPIPARPIPYKRDLWQIALPQNPAFEPKLLFSFRGSLASHPVRKMLHESLKEVRTGKFEALEKAFHSHTEEDQEQYIADILNARFSICPRGHSPSTYRVYESMQLGRCPVIISDDWIEPAGPNWDEFSIRVKESDFSELPKILQERSENALELGQRARAAWDKHFSWPTRYTYFLEQLKLFHESCYPMPERDKLLSTWRSYGFKRLYSWTLTSRLTRKIKSRL